MAIAEPRAASSITPLHRQLGLTDQEREAIRARLGRDPNDLELAMFSVMWSEHCSYKSSRRLLRSLPTGGAAVVAGVGEQAGVVSIGDGLAVAFKLESHNHPSAVEPYQGAATGVGGILRDIFSMGARPVAILDALKFGDPASARTRNLVRGVVGGISGYGNCVGVPTVGGELAFHPGYAENPLVNVMAVGVMEERHLTRAAAIGPGNLALLFGSTTGRDGIGGASVLASAVFGEQSVGKRPTVQVGDPFAEKLLIEASLELIDRQLIEGLQDLGAGGVTCATSETADRAGTGICVDLDAIPRREDGMAPFEVMISESQERMLAIIRPERLDDALEVCRRWDLPAAVIGRVTDDGDIRVVSHGMELARVPARALASEGIVQERIGIPPAHGRAAPAPGMGEVPANLLPERGVDPGVVLQAMLGHPNLASRAWVTTQYDATVGSDTLAEGGWGAATIRVRGTTKALVMATDACERIGAIDPWLGAAMAVAECSRNVSITGARPLGVTNCLNFGDPERPEAFWQLQEAVRGLGDACRALGLPVTGGNVSLYNEWILGAIPPTTQVGVVGLLDDVSARVPPAFRAGGDVIALVGEAVPGLGGSRYVELAGSVTDDRPPALDLEREAAVQDFIRDAASRRLLHSAQDVSGGGLAVALAESCLWGVIGADVQLPVGATPAVELFGEGPSQVVVSCAPRTLDELVALAADQGVPLQRLGRTGGDRLRIRLVGAGATGAAEDPRVTHPDELDEPLSELRRSWEGGLPRALGEEAWLGAERARALTARDSLPGPER